MLRRKPFRLALADTFTDLSKELATHEEVDQSGSFEETGDGFHTPDDRKARTVRERLGLESPPPPSQSS